jgi:hypothetical protein
MNAGMNASINSGINSLQLSISPKFHFPFSILNFPFGIALITPKV